MKSEKVTASIANRINVGEIVLVHRLQCEADIVMYLTKKEA